LAAEAAPTERSPRQIQASHVENEVFADETGDEVIAVVVTVADTQVQRVSYRIAGVLQSFGLQLRLEEFVPAALVDQYRQTFLHGRDQFAGVPRLPRFAVFAQIRGEGFLPPRHLRRRHDR